MSTPKKPTEGDTLLQQRIYDLEQNVKELREASLGKGIEERLSKLESSIETASENLSKVVLALQGLLPPIEGFKAGVESQTDQLVQLRNKVGILTEVVSTRTATIIEKLNPSPEVKQMVPAKPSLVSLKKK